MLAENLIKRALDNREQDGVMGVAVVTINDFVITINCYRVFHKNAYDVDMRNEWGNYVAFKTFSKKRISETEETVYRDVVDYVNKLINQTKTSKLGLICC